MRRKPKTGINIFFAGLLTVAAAYGQTVSPEPQNSPTPANSRESGAADREDETFADSRSENENEDALPTDSRSENIEDDFSKPPRRRIVSRVQIIKSQSIFTRLLLVPFRAVSPFIRERVTKFENEKELNRLGVFLSNPSIRPQIGGLGENSGFGAGVVFSTADKLSKDYKFFGSAHATSKSYVETLAGIEIAPQKWRRGKVRLNLTGRYLIRPSEPFFGSGADSFRSSRTSYFRRERGARFELRREFSNFLQIGAFTDFSRNSITEGKDSNSAPISQIFNSQTAPGLARGASLLESGIFAEYDRRDQSERSPAGFYLRLSASSADGLGKSGDFGYFNYDFDARAYLPVGSERRVFALRFLGSFKDRKGEAAVPFFRLARLGGGETLRGYESQRFQGINAVHLNLEYRFKLVQGIPAVGFSGVNAIFFTDVGQVFDRREELSFENIRATWGGGLQFVWGKNGALSFLYARSPEKDRLILRFGKTF